VTKEECQEVCDTTSILKITKFKHKSLEISYRNVQSMSYRIPNYLFLRNLCWYTLIHLNAEDFALDLIISVVLAGGLSIAPKTTSANAASASP